MRKVRYQVYYNYCLLQNAARHLCPSRNDFKDFSLHSRLHFRIQAVQDEVRAKMAAKKTDGSSSPLGSPVMPAGRKSSFGATDVVLPVLPVEDEDGVLPLLPVADDHVRTDIARAEKKER
jgi:hypothetical protein